MRALVNAPHSQDRLFLREMPEPEAQPDEVILNVRAFSINRGELVLLRNRPEGWRPGQDIAGVVQQVARSGRGPREGECVAALIDGAGWAERVAVPVERLARVPAGLGLEKAAAMPLAG